MKKLNILIVEDNPVIMKMTDRFFTRLSYKPDCAKTVAEALALVERKSYQLILTDIGLPDGDGMDLSKQVRDYEQSESQLPAYICAATAFALDDVRQDCYAAGVNDVIAKPIGMVFLEHLVQKAIAVAADQACLDLVASKVG